MSFVGTAIAVGFGASAATTLGAAGLGLSALSTGVSMSGALQPDQPNLNASSQAMADAQAALLPVVRQMQAQAELGQGPFVGMSEADIQGTIMTKLAQGQLTNAQDYDSQYIASALAQEAQSNPQGVLARSELYGQIQKQIATPSPVSPVSTEMQRQKTEQVAAGSGLTTEEQQMLDASIKERGGTTPGADFASTMTTGIPGEQRALKNAEAGTSWLSSGQTPEDVQYRADQQNLSNLSAYIGGQTPESQFKELSGAQSGPTPNYSGTTPLPGANLNAGAQGAQAGVTGYQQGITAALNQPNSWMTGLSALLGAGNTIGAAGYRPLATQVSTGGI
jgi:hypothetical protein